MSAKPRTKPAAERRDDLLNAAERLFLEKGVGETSVEDITMAAGVAKGSFYLHFASKIELLDVLRQRFIDTMVKAVNSAVEACSKRDFPGRLSAWARHCAAFYLDTSPLHHLVFIAAPPQNRDGLTRNAVIDSLEALLLMGCENKAWVIENTHLTAVLLFNGLHGAVHEPGAGEVGNRDRLLSMLVAHFRRSVGIGA